MDANEVHRYPRKKCWLIRLHRCQRQPRAVHCSGLGVTSEVTVIADYFPTDLQCRIFYCVNHTVQMTTGQYIVRHGTMTYASSIE